MRQRHPKPAEQADRQIPGRPADTEHALTDKAVSGDPKDERNGYQYEGHVGKVDEVDPRTAKREDARKDEAPGEQGPRGLGPHSFVIVSHGPLIALGALGILLFSANRLLDLASLAQMMFGEPKHAEAAVNRGFSGGR